MRPRARRFQSTVNHLAHMFLADRTAESVAGNLAADYLRGRVSNHAAPLREGIRLHRAVDAFTDHHDMVWRSRKRVGEFSGRYSGVVVDVFYDHLLSTEWSNYSQEPLEDFAADTYARLEEMRQILPEPLQTNLPRMIGDDWLLRCREPEGLYRSLKRLSTRVRNGAHLEEATEALWRDLSGFRSDFHSFFPELMQEVERQKRTPGTAQSRGI